MMIYFTRWGLNELMIRRTFLLIRWYHSKVLGHFGVILLKNYFTHSGMLKRCFVFFSPEERRFKGPGSCITNVIATCRKIFSQWERSFLWKLRCHWLKFLRHVAKRLVIQGPELLIPVIVFMHLLPGSFLVWCRLIANCLPLGTKSLKFE